MKRSEFSFSLPVELIAQHPLEKRDEARMLVVEPEGKIKHDHIANLVEYLTPDDLIIVNNTKVVPARLVMYNKNKTPVIVTLHEFLEGDKVWGFCKKAKRMNPDKKLVRDGVTFTYVERSPTDGILWQITGLEKPLFEWMTEIGRMPLPPYIKRQSTEDDLKKYQAIFAEKEGAVAAPTASLHFTDALLKKIKDKGIGFADVTLHVGLGTFEPMRADVITDHPMHKEYAEISKETVEKIKQTKAKGGRIVSIGTTALRTLETAAQDGTLKPYSGMTDIFIYPGYKFNVVDLLVTNFHLPESTLFMLVSAFSGLDEMKKAYGSAIDEKYRFFSYGDACLLFPKK